MALTRTIVLNRGNFPNGTRSIPAQAIADDITHIGLSLARCTTAEPSLWPNASTTVVASMEALIDGQWRLVSTISSYGGIDVIEDGIESPETMMLFSIPPGSGREIRGTVVIAGGPLRTEVSVLLMT
jgi:hypothetical protein